MKLTTKRKSIIKQPVLGLMYKTTVYMLVNRRITHQKQQISAKRWHYSAVHWHFGDVMLRNINLFLIFNFTHGCAFCGSGRWATTFRGKISQKMSKGTLGVFERLWTERRRMTS